jgi:hypothetical protein
LLACAALASALTCGAAGAQAKQTLGVTEVARIQPEGVLVTAKLDTGADTTSLHARAIRHFERDGSAWVAFDIADGGDSPHHLERELVRHSVIRKGQGARQRRPVVNMRICVGTVEREVQVNLVDRGDFNYRMLIGRNFMQGHIVVDPGLERTAAPSCADRAAP